MKMNVFYLKNGQFKLFKDQRAYKKKSITIFSSSKKACESSAKQALSYLLKFEI